jgi:hypothetical protein
MRSFIGSLTPADPAFKPWPCTRAAKKVILKERGGRKISGNRLGTLSSASHRSSRGKDNLAKSLLTEPGSCVILVKTAISNQRSAVSQKMGKNQERVFADS